MLVSKGTRNSVIDGPCKEAAVIKKSFRYVDPQTTSCFGFQIFPSFPFPPNLFWIKLLYTAADHSAENMFRCSNWIWAYVTGSRYGLLRHHVRCGENYVRDAENWDEGFVWTLSRQLEKASDHLEYLSFRSGKMERDMHNEICRSVMRVLPKKELQAAFWILGSVC